MPERPQLTSSGLLSEPYGDRPNTVRLREEREPGTNVVLDYSVGTSRRKESLGFAVRRKDRRRWAWDDDALERAREAAKDKSAELRLGRLRSDVEPETLTVGEAFKLYNDPERGNLPPSRSLRHAHIRAAKVWAHWLGKDTPWNRIKRNRVDACMKHYANKTSERTGETMIPTGLRYVEVLRACHNWLEERAGYDDLRDPTKGFRWTEWRKKHRPRRPRYTDDQAARLLGVRHRVDPRFALFLAVLDDSGARGKAIRSLWRSMVDPPLDQPPATEQAPYGWLIFPALKGQDPVLHYLTAFQRRELELAFDGYLSELEARYQEDGTDYPLFPAVRAESLTDGRPVRPSQSRAYQAVTRTGPGRWLREAERVAEVAHVTGRGYHGFRRRVADYLYAETDLKTLTTAGGWSSQRTPEQIYVEQVRHAERARAREAHERKREEG